MSRDENIMDCDDDYGGDDRDNLAQDKAGTCLGVPASTRNSSRTRLVPSRPALEFYLETTVFAPARSVQNP
jgi:hypothetical protein